VGDVLGVVRRELHGGGQQRVAQNVLRRWFMARLRRLRRHRVLPALSILAEGRILEGRLVSIRAIRDASIYPCRREFRIRRDQRLLMTVPPCLARNAKEPLLPREVIEADSEKLQ
jgi:hypothetical protein